jgi:hypothetical protein
MIQIFAAHLSKKDAFSEKMRHTGIDLEISVAVRF